MNILKTGSKALVNGNSFIQFGRTAEFLGVIDVVNQTQGSFSFGSSGAIQFLGVVVDALSGRIFVCNEANHTVSILDYTNPDSGSPTVISQSQGTFNGPSGIAIDYPSDDFTDGRIFVCNKGNSTVSILNYTTPTAGSPTVISSSQGIFSSPLGVAIDAESDRIFVTNAGTHNISILDYTTPTTNLDTITQTTGSFNTPSGIAIDSSNNRIFVCNRQAHTVTILDYTDPTADSPTIITQSQGGFTNPRAVVTDPANNRIIVVNNLGTFTVSILNYTNPTSGSPSKINLISASPSAIAIDALNNRIFLTALDQTLSIVTNIFN